MSTPQLMAALRRAKPEKYGATHARLETQAAHPAAATQAGLTEPESKDENAAAKKRTEREDLALQAVLDTARERSSDPVSRKDEVDRMLRGALGLKNTALAEHLIAQIAGSMNWGQFSTYFEKLSGAIAIMQEIQPANVTEALLACQMVGVHHASMRFLYLATQSDQTFEGRDSNMLRAARLMRLYIEQIDAMARLRGKTSQQKMTVEHVHVYEGAQAVVGTVVTPRTGAGVGGEEGK